MRVEVSDGSAGFPTPQEQRPDAPHGRGLHIVRALADAWGIEMQRDRPGKTVWFSLPLSLPGDGSPGGADGAGDDAPSGIDAARRGRRRHAPRPCRSRPRWSRPRRTSEPAWPVPGVRVVLDGLRDAVVATDEQGQIRYVNKAAEELLGWPPGTLVGRSVFDLVPDSLTAAFE